MFKAPPRLLRPPRHPRDSVTKWQSSVSRMRSTTTPRGDCRGSVKRSMNAASCRKQIQRRIIASVLKPVCERNHPLREVLHAHSQRPDFRLEDDQAGFENVQAGVTISKPVTAHIW